MFTKRFGGFGSAILRNLFRGQIGGTAIWTTPGVYSWTVPPGVTRISIICIGGGGAGMISNPTYSGGDGAGTGNGGTSAVIRSGLTIVSASGGRGGVNGGTGGTVIAGTGGGTGGTGGVGVDRANGGGGAAGYSGTGASGGSWTIDNGSASTVGGGGGGGAASDSTTWSANSDSIGGPGGGVGFYGLGENGTGGVSIANSTRVGGGGSGGTAGTVIIEESTFRVSQGGSYGGGGGSIGGSTGRGGGGGGLAYLNSLAVSPNEVLTVYVGSGAQSQGSVGSPLNYRSRGGNGAVKIIWWNNSTTVTRSFPSTSVAAINDIKGGPVIDLSNLGMDTFASNNGTVGWIGQDLMTYLRTNNGYSDSEGRYINITVGSFRYLFGNRITGNAAINLTGFKSTDIINIFNNGYIYGAYGAGGAGGNGTGGGSGGGAATPGINAANCNATEINLYNYSGSQIRGGGGGGGGGGGARIQTGGGKKGPSFSNFTGGTGGAGAGGHIAYGAGNTSADLNSSFDFGTSVSNGGTGGNGGAFESNGSNGASATGPGGSGGAGAAAVTGFSKITLAVTGGTLGTTSN